jgi:SAM-dependent methyltransferase
MRLGLGLKPIVRDRLDAVYLRVMDRPDLPRYTLRCHVGPADEYEALPAEYVTYFKLLCGLRMDERVLDIGCGTGRFALQLLGRPHFFHGSYHGFDVDARAIEWARANVPRAHTEFVRVDLRNEHYNPNGVDDAATFRFPYEDGSIDFAFAVSVFTHLPREVTAHYLEELHRILAPRGRALTSFVLLDEECEALTEPALTRLYDGVLRANGLASNGAAGRVFPMDGYATATPENPMIVTFYDESRVRELARTAGLEVHAVYHGSWSRMDGGPAFQDLVVLARR